MLIEAVMCLALNAYWEARNQSQKGMIGVSQVVMNRVESEYFPNEVCEVVKSSSRIYNYLKFWQSNYKVFY